MTKADEITALRTFIHQLPKDSYLRPWLESVVPEVEHEIHCDFLVSPSLPATRAQCAALLTETQAQCAQLKLQAQRTTEQLVTAARGQAERIRGRIYSDLQTCLQQLQ